MFNDYMIDPIVRTRRRLWAGAAIILSSFLVIIAQLFNLQFVQAASLLDKANRQRTVNETLVAIRGSIIDRKGYVLATTEQTRSLTFQPIAVRRQLDKDYQQHRRKTTTQDYLFAIAQMINYAVPQVPVDVLMEKLNSDELFVYLARKVKPEIAASIREQFSVVGSEPTPVRIYPAGSTAGNLVGVTRSDGPGLEGLELSLDAQLSGMNGSRTYDRSEDGAIIPGSIRDSYSKRDGAKIVLTIDADAQFHIQHKLDEAVRISGARSAQAVVLDSATGQVLAMATNGTYNPAQGPQALTQISMFNPTIQAPFEPGSVNKVISAAGLIEDNLTTPDEIISVPGELKMGGITVHDAWDHGVVKFTTTGVFGKSSNVGTLLLTQRLGEQRFFDLARKFGVGQRTGIELGGESAGVLPALQQWTGSSFANLPIGQGLSMTLLQMASMYQTIANDGVRITPRIVSQIINADNISEDLDQPTSVRVVSAQAARTVRRMFESVVQDDSSGIQRGTGVKAAVDGYRICGKTGTAQQWDSRWHKYSDTRYNITFAGIAPADHPRFVIALVLDNPVRSSDGSRGDSAAPLFHDIAQWLLNKYQIPLSSMPAPHFILQKL